MLIAMAGLPGAGKSRLAEALAARLASTIVSVDPIEAALWQAGVSRDQPTGLAAYVVAEEVARAQLRLDNGVLVDAVNDAEPAREQWRRLADEHACRLVFIEVFCSDPAELRRRLESRRRDLPGFREPTWESVESRRPAFLSWDEERIRVDSMHEHEANLTEVVAQLGRQGEPQQPRRSTGGLPGSLPPASRPQR